jgi:hypothetical protein
MPMHPGKRSTWDNNNWRPDLRASLSGAVVAALLVMVGFAALFTVAPFKLPRSAPAVREELILAEPTPAVPRPGPRARLARPTLPVALPELQRMLPPNPLAPLTRSDSFFLQEYLDERAKGNAAALRDQVMSNDLQRNLGKHTDKSALPDNQSFRSVGGQKIVRSGGACAQIQTVQGSSSPTNHIDIAEPTRCPGESLDTSQEMGKALDDWAKKAQQSQPQPP